MKDLTIPNIAFCDLVQITKDNKINVLDIFEEINTKNIKEVLKGRYLFMKFEGIREKNYKFEVKILHLQTNSYIPIPKKVLNQLKIKIDKNSLAYCSLDLSEIKLKKSGFYIFFILHNNEIIKQTKLNIKENNKLSN